MCCCNEIALNTCLFLIETIISLIHLPQRVYSHMLTFTYTLLVRDCGGTGEMTTEL